MHFTIPKQLFSTLLICAALNAACSSGTLSNDGPGDGGTDGGSSCVPECSAGMICRDGVCAPLDAACDGIVCDPGLHCENGRCVADDPCDDIVCSNPGEVCQGGECVSGEGDEDGDGVIAREDCDDTDPLIFPGAPERCNGIADSCDVTIPDGESECPGFCCGSLPACHDCCEQEQCGGGLFECSDFSCVCSEVQCGDVCLALGSCCTAAECGAGGWMCSDSECTCPGVVCDGVCIDSGECCSRSDCGDGDWSCNDHECSCGLMVVDSDRCGLCEGRSYSGRGCSDCPEGSFEVYCPGPGCSRACVTDSSCSNRYRHDASDSWIDNANAFCFSGTHMDDTYWEMR